MYQRWKAAGLKGPALMTLAMLPVLIGLGTWQWQRKTWKEDLIGKIAARVKAEPVSYIGALAQYVRSGDVEYLRVRVTGTFNHSQERHLYAPAAASQGWHVFTLFQPDGNLPPLFVNRGWVPEPAKDPQQRLEGQISGPVTVTGLARLPETNRLFTPQNDYTGNRWYWRDLRAMRWGPDAPRARDFESVEISKGYAPFSLDAEAEPANPGGWPKGGTTEINISNRHLEYIVTWYGLAVTLLAIFAVFVRQRLVALDNKSSTEGKNT